MAGNKLALKKQKAILEAELERRKQASETPKPVFKYDTEPQDHHKALATAFPLRKFTYQAFSYIHQGQEFKNNWHIDAITELLQSATLGQVRKFIINIPRRCMKPLSGETLVLLKNGRRVKLKYVKKGDEVITKNNRSKKVLDTHKQGELKCLKITTFSGRQIISALDHPFLTPQGWIEAQNLSIGQSLALLPDHNNHNKPSFLDAEFTIAGYFIGDGAVSHGNCNITSKNPDYINDLWKNVKQMKWNMRTVWRKNGVGDIRLTKGAREWLDKIGIRGLDSKTKKVPDFIFQGTNYQVARFISAYFNCDGCVTKQKKGSKHFVISFTSISKQLLQGVQHLLLRLGIYSRLRARLRKLSKNQPKDYVYYNLDISRKEDGARFFENIPISSYKKEQLREYGFIRTEFKPQYYADPIVEIEDVGKFDCYCLTVEDDYSFIANDFVVHNSTLLCIAWTAWEWSFLPNTKWLFNSYNKQFTIRDHTKTAELIKSEWYQYHFGDKFQLTSESENKGIRNSMGGYRYIFKMGGGTGEGGDRIICDDPNNIEKSESIAETDAVVRGFREVAYSNYIDPKTVIRGIIQQRTSNYDLTADLTRAREHDYEHLVLPMEFDEKHPSVSRPFNFGKVDKFDVKQYPNLQIGQPKLFIDPRSKNAPKFDNEWYQYWKERFYNDENHKSEGNGELLWKGRLDKPEIDDMKKELKVFAVAGQLQQNPTARGGNYFEIEKFNEITYEDLVHASNDFDGWNFILYIDKAGTEGDGDYTVMLLMTRTPKPPFKYYILHVYRQQVGYEQRVEDIKNQIDNHLEILDNTNYLEYSAYIEVEHNSSAKDLKGIEAEEFGDYPVDFDQPRGNTNTRAKIAKLILDRGGYWIVKDFIENGWIEPYIDELGRFNPARKRQPDDQVDGTTGATRKLRVSRRKGRGSRMVR